MAGVSTPFFLYPTGSPPVTVKAGVRSLFAFWIGGATATSPHTTTGPRSLLAFWIGGAAGARASRGVGRPKRTTRVYEKRRSVEEQIWEIIEESKLEILESVEPQATKPLLRKAIKAQVATEVQQIAPYLKEIELLRVSAKITRMIIEQIEEEEAVAFLLLH